MKRLLRALFTLLVPVFAFGQGSNVTAVSGSDIGAKINASVTRCAGAPCPIVVPSGTYNFSTPVILASNVDLSCAGEHETTLHFTPLTGIAIVAGESTTNVKVHDCSITGTQETPGTAASYNNATGLSLMGTHSVADHVAISHFWKHSGALTIEGGYNTVSNSDLEFDQYPLAVGGAHNVARGNYLNTHYSSAQSFEAPGVHYWDCITAEGATSLLIEANTVEDCGQSGIYFGANGNLTKDIRVIGNHVLHAWNRGIDLGVSGHVTSSNAVSGFAIQGNTVTDSRLDNIWLVCDSHGVVSGNTSLYTSNYTAYYGRMASGSRNGIALYDGCSGGAPTAADSVTYVSITKNIANDQTGTSFSGIGFNVNRDTSLGNSCLDNVTDRGLYIAHAANLKLNKVQQQNPQKP